MGMYDEITALCPNCKKAVVFQSKAGECRLKNYSIDSVPLAIADALDGETETCEACNTVVKVQIPRSASKRITMEVTTGTGDEWD